MKNSIELRKVAVFLAVAVPFVVLFFWLSKISVDNVWLVRAFDVDESGVLADLQSMLNQETWKPLNYIYGSAHTYMTLIMVKGWSWFSDVGFVELCVSARLVNALSLVGIGALFVGTQTKTMAWQWILLFLLALFFSGTNFSYALNSKPELLQAFFVVGSLVAFKAFLVRLAIPLLFLAGMLAGMAFATKYAGLLLLAFLTLCLLAGFVSLKKGDRLALLLGQWLVSLYSGAVCGVAVLGPYLIIDFPTVYQVIGMHSTVIGKGFLFLDDKKWSEWFTILFSRDVFWWALAAGGLMGALPSLRDWPPGREGWLPRMLFVLWALFYFCYLLVMVKEKSVRYLIVLLPFLYFLVFCALSNVSLWLLGGGRRKAAAALFVVSAFLVFTDVAGGISHVVKGITDKAASPRVVAGTWLLENVGHERMIASDLYTYVPPEFTRHFHRTYLAAYDVLTVRPDFLVVSRTIMSRYLDMGKAEEYRQGREAFMRHHYLYAKLERDSFPGYKIVKDYGEVLIFQRGI